MVVSVLCKTTCHPAFMHKLPTFWAVKSNIQVSGGLTTSRGPGTSYGFALCLVEQLFGESVAKEIGESLVSGEPYYCISVMLVCPNSCFSLILDRCSVKSCLIFLFIIQAFEWAFMSVKSLYKLCNSFIQKTPSFVRLSLGKACLTSGFLHLIKMFLFRFFIFLWYFLLIFSVVIPFSW